MQAVVALSSGEDGSMHDRNDPLNPQIIHNREVWLHGQGLSLDDTTRLLIRFGGDDYCRYKDIGVDEKGVNMRGDDDFIADAIVTTTPGHALLLPVADCIATTIFDPVRGVLMLAHLGRHSLEQQGGVKVIEYLAKSYGSKAGDLQVWLSPSINKESYPIYKLSGLGMKEACWQQLSSAGVHKENIVDDTRDTGSNDMLYSYSEFLKGYKQVDGCQAMLAVMRN